MKSLSTLMLFCIGLTSYGQTETNDEEKQQIINIDAVNEIHISAYCAPTDTCSKSTYRLYLLDDTMSLDLINRVNNSASTDPCDFNAFESEYVLYIHFKDGTKKDFKMIAGSIKMDIDRCLEIHDADYFENLWTALDNKWSELN